MFIRLQTIKLFAHHGVYEAEIKNGNHFEIDIEVEVTDTLGTASDEISDALDYTKLYGTVIAVSENRRYNLLEAFSCDICMKVLEAFPVILFTAVKVRKLNPPMGGEIKSVEVEYQKRRA